MRTIDSDTNLAGVARQAGLVYHRLWRAVTGYPLTEEEHEQLNEAGWELPDRPERSTRPAKAAPDDAAESERERVAAGHAKRREELERLRLKGEEIDRLLQGEQRFR